jgi:hypothetical protein
MDGSELTRPNYWASAACWSQGWRNCQDEGTRRNQWCISVGDAGSRAYYVVIYMRLTPGWNIDSIPLWNFRLGCITREKKAFCLFGDPTLCLPICTIAPRPAGRLLTWAVAAREAHERQDALADLWDLMLQFESELSYADRSSVKAIQNVGKIRPDDLLGPDEKDVATGKLYWCWRSCIGLGPKDHDCRPDHSSRAT